MNIIRRIFVFACILLSFGAAVANGQPRVILHLNWGDAPENVGLRKAPEAYYGPQAFQVIDSSVWILDSPHNVLKEFRQEQYVQSLPVPPFSDDFVLQSKERYTVLSQNTVYYFENGHPVSFYRAHAPQELIASLHPVTPDELLLRFSSGHFKTFDPRRTKTALLKPAGSALAQKLVFARRQGPHLAHIELGNGRSFNVAFPQKNLASVRWIGTDARENIYLNFEFFVQQTPLRIQRMIVVFDTRGQKLLSLNVPVNNYTKIFRDVDLHSSGALFQMRSTPAGVEIVRWDLAPLFNPQNPPLLDYPSPFKEGVHYNWLIRPDSSETEHALEKTADFEDYPQVISDDVLSTGAAYESLSWTCSADNLTDGVVYDDQGYPVRTPSWIVVGDNLKMPYKWGGFETVEMYLYGIDILKYAGDNYTDKCCGSDAAVGVDCSGFVSRCWNLPKHYSTSMMDDGLTLPYLSWSELEPGDAVHKVGHVRLMVKHNGDGSLTVLEASGKDWRVSYRVYYYGDLSAYTPRYYVNREGAPGNIPQPRLDLVTASQQTSVTWAVGGLENIQTLRLYRSADGNTWTQTDIPKDSTHFSQPIADGQAIYYRLTSISSENQTEGVPSDAYGVFRNDEKAKVLIVDGFDRTTASSGEWPKIYHSFGVTFGRALENAGIPFESTDNDAVLAHKIYLGDYPAVFWILGDESTHDGTFTKEEQELVRDYLQNGGMLFVSGSEIGWDLDHKGTQYDKTFYADYLKAEYELDDAATYTALGQSGSPFEGLTVHFDDGTHGVYNVAYPDVIKAINGASVAFNYDNGGAAGLYFEGTFPGGSKKGKLVYLAFPFETVYDESERNALMSKIVTFFGLDHLSGLGDHSAYTPARFRLLGNAPNPFNNQTRIRFYLPAAGTVTLSVFNVLGQAVFRQKQAYAAPGLHHFRFSGDGLPSGVYLYTLTFEIKTAKRRQQGKMLLVK